MFLEFWEALEDAKNDGCNMELIAGSGKLEKTRFDVTLLEQEVGRLSLEGLLLFMYPN